MQKNLNFVEMEEGFINFAEIWRNL